MSVKTTRPSFLCLKSHFISLPGRSPQTSISQSDVEEGLFLVLHFGWSLTNFISRSDERLVVLQETTSRPCWNQDDLMMGFNASRVLHH